MKDFTYKTMTSPYVKINDIELMPYMLKSLDPFIMEEEEMLLRKYSNVFKRGWLYDDVIEAFLFKILHGCDNYMIISPFNTLSVFHSKVLNANYLNSIRSKEYLFIPFSLKSHWVLIVANLKKHTFEFYDPLHLNCSDSSYNYVIDSWHDVLNNFSSVDKWPIYYPPHILQKDNMNCGVFICYYAYQKIQNLNLNDPFDPIIFRKFIFENLILQF